MASVESIIRQGRVAYRGRPWDAVSRKHGPSKVFDTESAARSYAEGWQKDQDKVAEAFGVAPTRNRKHVKLTEYAMQCAKRWDGTEQTRRSRITMARVLEHTQLAALNVHEIDRRLINEMIAEDMSSLAPGTKRNRLSFLNRVFVEAALDGLIEASPMRDIERPRRVTLRGHSIPTEGDLAKILHSVPDWFEVAVLLAHDSGLRASEVAGLRWFRIDWKNRRVTVKDIMDKGKVIRPYPKGKEQRVVPLSARTITALKQARKRQGAGDLDFVVRRPNGRSFSSNALSTFWGTLARQVPSLTQRPTFHDFRHACAHRLVRHGISMPVLQAFMGHKSLATTQLYMPTVTPDAMAEALAAIPVVSLVGA